MPDVTCWQVNMLGGLSQGQSRVHGHVANSRLPPKTNVVIFHGSVITQSKGELIPISSAQRFVMSLNSSASQQDRRNRRAKAEAFNWSFDRTLQFDLGWAGGEDGLPKRSQPDHGGSTGIFTLCTTGLVRQSTDYAGLHGSIHAEYSIASAMSKATRTNRLAHNQ